MDVMSHADHQRLTARVSELSQENEQLKRQVQNAEAETGWFRAQWDKQARHQIHQTTSHVQDRAVTPRRWSRVQKESRPQKRLVLAFREQRDAPRAPIDDSGHEKTRPDQSLSRMQDHVSRLCRKYMKSSMVAAAYSELPPEELLELLERHVDQALQETRTRSVQESRSITRLRTVIKNQKQTIQDLRDDIEATKQAQQERIQVLEDAHDGWRDRVSHWRTQVRALQRFSVDVSREGMTDAESTQVGSRTCPHVDRQMVSYTLCSMCLCEDCDRAARESTYNGNDTVACLHCFGVCTVMTLPPWWHRLWTSRWERVRSQTESMCETLNEIDLA